MIPLVFPAVIYKEGTITSPRQPSAQEILPAAAIAVGATGYISQTLASCTSIPRIRLRVRLPFLSTALWIFFWGILLTPLSLGLGLKPKRQAPGGTGSPIWTIDLRSVGFTGFAPKQEQWGIHLKPNPLCFVDNKTLIATFVTREEITTLAHRDQPSETSPLRLHAVFLDPEVGIVLATKEWPVTRPRGGVIATGAGRFAVLTPAMIALYSPSRELLKDLKFSSAEQSDLWDLHSSPSGKSIVAEYHT